MSSKSRGLRKRARAILLWAGLSFALLQVGAALLPATRTGPFDDLGVWQVPPLETSIVQWQTRQLAEPGPAQDVIFFGDSACLMGVRSRQVQEIAGLRVWNFGTLGWLGTEGHAEILAMYLEKHAPPRLAVYYISTYPLTATKEDLEAAGYLRTLKDWRSGDRREGALFWLEDHKLRWHLQSMARHWFSTPAERDNHLSAPRGVYPSDLETRRLLIENRGFIPERCPQKVHGAGHAYLPKFSPDCVAGLRRMFELAEGHGVTLWVIMNPLPEAYHCADTDRRMQEWEHALRSLARGHAHVHIKSPLHRYYPNECFGTIFHLLEPGVDRNSRELGQWLADEPPPRTAAKDVF
jgi:hypothetical protein